MLYRHTLAWMCAKNHLLIFSSFLDIWENVEWPRFFGPPCISRNAFPFVWLTLRYSLCCCWWWWCRWR